MLCMNGGSRGNNSSTSLAIIYKKHSPHPRLKTVGRLIQSSGVESGRKQRTIVGFFFFLSSFLFPNAAAEITMRSQYLSVPSSVLPALGHN